MTQPPSSFLPGVQPKPPLSQGHCGYKMEQNHSVAAQERISESPPWDLLFPGLESRPGPGFCSPRLSGAANGYSTAISRRVLSHAFLATFLIQSPEHGMDQIRSDTRLPPSWSLLQAQLSTPAPNPAHLLSSSRDRRGSLPQ